MEPLDLLVPENSALQPVDPALAKVKRIAHAAPLLFITVAAAVAAVAWTPWMWLGVLACVLYFAYIYWLIGRRVRAPDTSKEITTSSLRPDAGGARSLLSRTDESSSSTSMKDRCFACLDWQR